MSQTDHGSGSSTAERSNKRIKLSPATAITDIDAKVGDSPDPYSVAEACGPPAPEGVIGCDDSALASGRDGRPGESAPLIPTSGDRGTQSDPRHGSNGHPVPQPERVLDAAGSRGEMEPVTVPTSAACTSLRTLSPETEINAGRIISDQGSGKGVGGSSAGGDAGSCNTRVAVCGEARSQEEMAGSCSSAGGVAAVSTLPETGAKRPRLEVEVLEIVDGGDSPERVSNAGEGGAVGGAADTVERDPATGFVGAVPENASSSRGPAGGATTASQQQQQQEQQRQQQKKRQRAKQKQGKVRLLPLDDTFDVKLSAKVIVVQVCAVSTS